MSEQSVNPGRRRFLISATSAVSAVGVVGVAVPFVASWNPSAKAKAAGAPVQVNISKLEPGQMIIEEWRGKPIFIVRRTEAMLSSLTKVAERLQDPASEQPQQPDYVDKNYRSIKPEVLVMIGLCTHLGCSPKGRFEVGTTDFDNNWFGGFFCPCHGSKFDMAGRVYKNVPAPKNLPIPPYRYVTENTIEIGTDEETA